MNDIPLNTTKMRSVIPIDGAGMLDDSHAEVILRQQEYKNLIENRGVFIEFRVGKKATDTLPFFWSGLLLPVINSYISELKECINVSKYQEVLNLLTDRFTIEFDGFDPSNAPIEEKKRVSDIAHRFDRFLTDYVNLVGNRMFDLEEAEVRSAATEVERPSPQRDFKSESEHNAPR